MNIDNGCICQNCEALIPRGEVICQSCGKSVSITREES